MSFLKNHRRWFKFLLVSASMILIPLFIYSCGGHSEYSDLPENVGVMITSESLNSWVKNGFGGDSFGNTRMAILQIDTEDNYDDFGHVPGAFFVDQKAGTDLKDARNDGIIKVNAQVPTRSMMDAMIQRTGIDGATLIVITGNNMQIMGRLYWNFRYWGFRKGRLKVLNGTLDDYTAAGYPLTWTPTPEPEPSTYSVCEHNQSTSVDKFRASLEEMRNVAADSDPATLPLDIRTPEEFNGEQSSITDNKVAFTGRIRGAKHLQWEDLLEGGTASNYFKSKEDIEAIITVTGMDSSKTAYLYCQIAQRTSVSFLALDGILGWSAKMYDGSWLEWGNLSDDEGTLESDSPWRTDNSTYTDILGFSVTNKKPPVGNSFAANAKEINEEDKAACN
ncbi:MAG: hypothetical protein L0956_07475 [Candidatus Mariimomonas ferrooxydans]